jgi:hypothetical protein
MPFQTRGGLRFYEFENLSKVVHAVFTRRGGVSPAPWDSLNIGGTVGDEPGHVQENRTRMLEALQLSPESVYDVWQVHGTDVVIADGPRQLQVPHQRADAILTDRPGIVLLMRFADCVPILLHDPVHAVVGIAHAGWMGTVQKVVTSTIQKMGAVYGSRPGELQAAIGPSIGPDHYAVGPDVAGRVEQAFGHSSADLLATRQGTTYLDLWQANRLLLAEAGVTSVATAGLCTACATQDWFSHRAELGRTGRFGALIALR